MIDNKIIKALECYRGQVLFAFNGKKPKIYIHDILDLINRQKAEIERLNGENKAFGEIIKKQDDEISVLRKDLLKREDLEKSFSKTVKQFDKKLAKTVKLERVEAFKEFAERLSEKAPRITEERFLILQNEIDNLVKEMVGE